MGKAKRRSGLNKKRALQKNYQFITFFDIKTDKFNPIYLGGSHNFLTNSIAYSCNASGSSNSLNESMSVVDDGYALFLQPLGISFHGSGQNFKKLLSQQGAAEYFWEILLRALQ